MRSSGGGGAKAIGDVAALGNMVAGLSAQKAGWLIDKWFLGRDLPMPVVGGDTANSKAASGVYNYATVTGGLFVGGVSAEDINQGSAGTCYLVASMGAIAGVNGGLITDAVTDNGNGSYGVRFYLDGAPVYVTVDRNVPVTGTNRVALSSNAEHSLSGESWASLIEKAYAQLNAQANINNAKSWSGEASYQAVEGGWANPIKQLTNLSYRYYSSYYAGVPDNFKTSEVTSADAGTYKQTIIDALAGGAVGWLASFGNTTDAGNGKRNLVSGHAFMLLGYDAGTDLFTVRNPWGGSGGDYNVQFTAAIGDFWNPTVKGIVALSEVGAAPPVFGYALATSAGEAAPATEGDAVTLTVNAGSGGDLTRVAAQLDGGVDVVKILANSSAFAALRADGSVVTWGYGPYGGDAAAVGSQLVNVVSLAATEQAFAALRADGSVVTWGSFLGGGNSAEVAAALDGTIDVVQVTSTRLAFAALRADGSVITWGDQVQGGFSGAVAPVLTGVSRLAAGANATATADLAIAAADAAKAEGGAGAVTPFTFTVTRSGNTGLAISVPFSVGPGALRPAGAAAFSGGALPSGTVNFAAGVTSATITITVDVAGDAALEGNQEFVVTLGPAPAGVALVATAAGGTILEDEAISDIVAVNGTSDVPMAMAPVFYSGPVAGVEREMILLSPENLTIALGGPNWFVHSGSGNDAIAAFGGTNVLDGGTGSNFLTGGPGADTFFVDARGATAAIWSTVNSFGPGMRRRCGECRRAVFRSIGSTGRGRRGSPG